MSTPADFSTYHPITRSEELRWSLDPIVQKKLDDGRMDYTIVAEKNEIAHDNPDEWPWQSWDSASQRLRYRD